MPVGRSLPRNQQYAGWKSNFIEKGNGVVTIKAVLFDFDGTLADTLPVSFKAFQSVFKKYDKRDVSREELVAMFGPTEDEIILRNLDAKGSVPEAIRDYYQLYEQGHPSQVHKSDEIERMLRTIKSWA